MMEMDTLDTAKPKTWELSKLLKRAIETLGMTNDEWIREVKESRARR